MQAGLLIEYAFNGDDAQWRASVEDFIGHIRRDTKLDGKFSYVVMRGKADASRRIHIPRWDSAETLAYVQAQPWFKAFAEKTKAFAGDTMTSSPITVELDSRA